MSGAELNHIKLTDLVGAKPGMHGSEEDHTLTWPRWGWISRKIRLGVGA